jgi:threonine/homoserine/homoserine lactone efflux protein
MPLSVDLVLALAAFSLVTSITPGPNNVMLLTSGLNFGFRRTIPHMLGIGVGCVAMIAAVGFGAGELASHQVLYTALRLAGAGYLLWLAWQIANARPTRPGADEGESRPISFWSAAAFQWVNPKTWVMVVGATITYGDPRSVIASTLVVAIVFWAVNLPCISAWVLVGTGLRRFRSDPKTLRRFNIAMALLLVASMWPLVADLTRNGAGAP